MTYFTDAALGHAFADADAVIVGAGPLGDSLRAQAAAAHVSDRIVFTGEVDDDGARAHEREHIGGDQFGRGAAGDEGGGDDDVHLLGLLAKQVHLGGDEFGAHGLGVAGGGFGLPELLVLHGDELGAQGCDLLLRRRPHVRCADDGAEPSRGRNGLQAGHAHAHDEHLGRSHSARGRHHHWECAAVESSRFDHGAIAGEIRLRAQRVHRLRTADARDELHRDRVDPRRVGLGGQIGDKSSEPWRGRRFSEEDGAGRFIHERQPSEEDLLKDIHRPCREPLGAKRQARRHHDLIEDIRAAGARIKLIQDGDVAGRGHRYRHVKGAETLRAAVAAGDYGKPTSGPYVGRGLALVDRPIGAGPTGVVLRLRPDGRLDVRYGLPDQGVGMSTMLRQVVAEALAALKAGAPRVVRFGVGSAYVDIKLPCGGGLDIHFQPLCDNELVSHACEAIAARVPFSIAVDGDARFIGGWERGEGVFGHWPALRLLIVGHGASVEALARLARGIDLESLVLTPDARLLASLAEQGLGVTKLERTSDTHLLASDPWTAIVFLFHDHDWEVQLMASALALPHCYIGAMGSRRAHAARCAALASAGVSAEAIALIKAPLGLFHSSRDPETLARPWALPGTPGLEHRIGGLEKDYDSGHISYDPDNHARMTKARADKIAGIARDIPLQDVTLGNDEGKLAVVGWGSTFGAIHRAVTIARQEGGERDVSHIHLRYLNPFPRNTGEVLRRYDALDFGGALGYVEEDGFRWDSGPTATLLPAVIRDFFRKSGRPAEKEIDLVARDAGTLVFVEVKARASAEFGTAAEAVTRHKQRRLGRMAAEYLVRINSDSGVCGERGCSNFDTFVLVF